MKTAQFDYHLPPELIAQQPVEPRDSSRLLVVNRKNKEIKHCFFRDLPSFVCSSDCLVVNETKVIPARLKGEKLLSGGKVEILLLSQLEEGKWEALVKPSRRLSVGQVVAFGSGVRATIEDRRPDGTRLVSFDYSGDFRNFLRREGKVPLPPYIYQSLEDEQRYQTIYAKREESVAAPTAGLHFTSDLLKRLKAKGVRIAPISLRVGLDSFQPVRETDLEKHKMHSEHYEIFSQTASLVNKTIREGGQVFAIGTTSARVLETVAGRGGEVNAKKGHTDLFIYPGYRFKAVDHLLTNFHLPRSTLLMLVCAFAGRDLIMEVYTEAIRQKYRFLSFGDAMLIL